MWPLPLQTKASQWATARTQPARHPTQHRRPKVWSTPTTYTNQSSQSKMSHLSHHHTSWCKVRDMTTRWGRDRAIRRAMWSRISWLIPKGVISLREGLYWGIILLATTLSQMTETVRTGQAWETITRSWDSRSRKVSVETPVPPSPRRVWFWSQKRSKSPKLTRMDPKSAYLSATMIKSRTRLMRS